MDQKPLSSRYIKDDKFLNALAEAYRLQEAIIGATELAIISANLDGTITSFNRAAENLLGYTAEEVVGKETPVLFHDQEEILKRSKQLELESGIPVKSMFDVLSTLTLKNNNTERSEWTYVSKTGRRFPVSLSVTVLKDENDHVFGFAGIATDVTAQKEAEKKLRESEAHLHAVLTSMDSSTFEIDEHGRYVKIWSSHAEIAGTQVSDMWNKTFADLYGDDVAAAFDAMRKKVLLTGEPQEAEFKAPRAGDERWYSIKYSRILDHAGNPTQRLSSSVSNITTKKKTELALKESEEKFRLLAENIPGAIYLRNNDSTHSIIYFNRGIENITGFRAEEFVAGGVSIVDLYHPEDAPVILRDIAHALAQKTSFDLMYRIKHRSMEWRWVKESGMGLYDERGNLTMLEGVIIDVTAQKSAEEELLQVAAQSYTIFNNAVSLNVVAGFDGYFKRVNPMWEKLTGWTINELSSKPFLDFVHPEDRDATRDADSYITSGNDLLTFENRYRCKDGTYRWLLWSSASDSARQLIYATAIDISARKKTEEDLLVSKKELELLTLRLQEQNRQLDEFAHIISHNLRSPIGNIGALISLLNDKSSLDEYQMIFDKLKNLSVNLGETMSDLMDTIRVKKNTQVDRVEIRFKDVLDKVIQSLEGELIRSGAMIHINFDEAPTIVYSRAYLESIFQNLLSNAVKYRSAERTPIVSFETKKTDNHIQLCVEDNGLGIDLKKFGDKLFGLHKTFHENKEARGVGLFLIKTQIEALGGSIRATSEPGKGTTFIVTF